jgi:hypothetical protein
MGQNEDDEGETASGREASTPRERVMSDPPPQSLSPSVWDDHMSLRPSLPLHSVLEAEQALRQR